MWTPTEADVVGEVVASVPQGGRWMQAAPLPAGPRDALRRARDAGDRHRRHAPRDPAGPDDPVIPRTPRSPREPDARGGGGASHRLGAGAGHPARGLPDAAHAGSPGRLALGVLGLVLASCLGPAGRLRQHPRLRSTPPTWSPRGAPPDPCRPCRARVRSPSPSPGRTAPPTAPTSRSPRPRPHRSAGRPPSRPPPSAATPSTASTRSPRRSPAPAPLSSGNGTWTVTGDGSNDVIRAGSPVTWSYCAPWSTAAALVDATAPRSPA